VIAGIGGVFIHARDAAALARWYQDILGIEVDAQPEHGYFGHEFTARDASGDGRLTRCVWSIMQREPGDDGTGSAITINYRVDGLDAFVERIRERGGTVERTEAHEYGKFAWLIDPEGNKVELWEDSGAT
jgi:predicted enzyme related to lactoylglutathione lyase